MFVIRGGPVRQPSRGGSRESAARFFSASMCSWWTATLITAMGYHGRVYLNPHQLFRRPSTVWRFAQDLIDVLPPEFVSRTEIVAGPATGGALLAHTLAGLLDSRRSLTRPPCAFAPFTFDPAHGLALRAFYAKQMGGRQVLLADDIRNTGQDVSTAAPRWSPKRAVRLSARWRSTTAWKLSLTWACRTSRWPSTNGLRITRQRPARSARPGNRSRASREALSARRLAGPDCEFLDVFGHHTSAVITRSVEGGAGPVVHRLQPRRFGRRPRAHCPPLPESRRPRGGGALCSRTRLWTGYQCPELDRRAAHFPGRIAFVLRSVVRAPSRRRRAARAASSLDPRGRSRGAGVDPSPDAGNGRIHRRILSQRLRGRQCGSERRARVVFGAGAGHGPKRCLRDDTRRPWRCLLFSSAVFRQWLQTAQSLLAVDGSPRCDRPGGVVAGAGVEASDPARHSRGACRSMLAAHPLSQPRLADGRGDHGLAPCAGPNGSGQVRFLSLSPGDDERVRLQPPATRWAVPAARRLSTRRA